MGYDLETVGIADLKVAQAPVVLRTILGSCVGICLYDPVVKVIGLSHIMLPDKTEKSTNDKKYADTAIPQLIEEMLKIGAKRENMIAKIAGGATMFKMAENTMMGAIGKNNATKVREVLDKYKIRIIAEDIGGDNGRTIDFDSQTGEVKVKTAGNLEKII